MKQRLSKTKFIILAFSLLLMCFNVGNFNLKAQTTVPAATQDYLPNQLLVKLKSQDKIYKIDYPQPIDVLSVAKTISQRPEVEVAEPNYMIKAAYTPNDPLYNEQWNFSQIQAPQSWDMVPGGSEDVVIAVLDTGVDIDHPDLKNNIWINKQEIAGNGVDDDKNGYIDDYAGWDFVKNVPDPKPKFEGNYNIGAINHGTLVAGIAAAVGDNHEGVVGLAWKSKIMALRVLDSQGVGSVDSVIAAINYAKNNGAKIINLSFVGTGRSEFLAQAIKEAWKNGLIIVAAAGNEATGQIENLDVAPSYPICLDLNDTDNYIIGVAATDQSDRKASFSNFGSSCVDITAPGSRIYGLLVVNPSLADYQNRYGGYWSGTSVAVPLVSGAAALLKSLNPLLTNQQVRDILLDQADNIDSANPDYVGKLGRGRLNVYRAVSYVYSQLMQATQTRYIVTAAGRGGGPHIRVMKSNGLPISGFMAYDTKFSGGVRVATGDIDGDGQEEIVTVPASNGGSHVRIFDITGAVKSQFFTLKNYYRGLNVTTCDLDGDRVSDIIVTPNGGTDPVVYVYDNLGQLKHKFLAYNKSVRQEVKVVCGDIDGDGDNEIITSLGSGGSPLVRIFSPNGDLELQWYAFLEKFKGGINIAVGDVNNDGRAEIIASIAGGASPYVRVFDYFGFLQTQFLAYDRNYFNGVNLAVNDLNGDSQAEIITGTGRGSPPHVRIFDYLGVSQGGFFAYDRRFLGGVSVATINGD